MFKRYSCGCVGFVLRSGIVCVKSCDSDGYSPAIQFYDRTDDLIRKSSEMLTDAEVEELIEEIGKLVNKGNALASLQSAMRAAGL